MTLTNKNVLQTLRVLLNFSHTKLLEKVSMIYLLAVSRIIKLISNSLPYIELIYNDSLVQGVNFGSIFPNVCLIQKKLFFVIFLLHL